MAFNKVILLGNLTRDPETRSTTSGQSVTNFSVAVNETWVDKSGEKQERTSFIECEAWGQRGETIAKYFTKGRQILVEGRLRQDSWEDKDTGKNRSTLRVTVDSFSFINDGRGGGTSAPMTTSKSKKSDDADEPVIDDVSDEPIDLTDIPF
ncbi:MAG: single-stranded DNA-binding protein [Candidatus Nomurabacteria bacterium]|jgi:single-strand DNA-binding protein|nr:single-stranded DNA-binding protein [Candidatus Nomurabacteria bacterium]